MNWYIRLSVIRISFDQATIFYEQVLCIPSIFYTYLRRMYILYILCRYRVNICSVITDKKIISTFTRIGRFSQFLNYRKDEIRSIREKNLMADGLEYENPSKFEENGGPRRNDAYGTY